MELTTSRLRIRTMVQEDWRNLLTIWEDFNRGLYAAFDMPHCTDPVDVKSRIGRWAEASLRGNDHLFFSVCLKDAAIGFAAFNSRQDAHDLGYCFHSRYHGNGYGKESLQALLACLPGLGIHRITAGTALKNLPSVALLPSLSFRQIGTEPVSFYKDASGSPFFLEGGLFEFLL